MDENKENTQNNGQENNAGKETAKYEKNLSKLIAILGGKEYMFPMKKVGGTALTDLVTELLKEKKEKLAIEIKTNIQNLLDKKVQFDKDVKAEEDKFKKIKEQKQKEFNEACSKVFAQIDGIDQMEKDYLKTLSGNDSIGLTDAGPQA